MAAATNEQVQQFVNERLRIRSEQIRNVYLACKDDAAVIGDVYENVSNPATTWTDNHPGNPPHLLTPNDVLAYNTFLAMFALFVEGGLDAGNMNTGGAQYPVIQDACVSPVTLI